MLKRIMLLMIFSILLSAINSFAGILYVKSDGNGDCSSWTNACSLQTALSKANYGDEIWVQKGVYYPGTKPTDMFRLRNGVAIYGGFLGTETTLNQRNWRSNLTILSGDIDQNDVNEDANFIAEAPFDIKGVNAYTIVSGYGIDNSTILDGFVITAGNNVNSLGAGIYLYESSPVLRNIIIIGNYANSGAGLYINIGNPELINATFKNNYSLYFGGGIYINLGNIVIKNSIFNRNYANSGGGIYNSGANMVIENSAFTENTSSNGGGIYQSYGNLNLKNSTFDGNYASYGGAIYISLSNNIILTNVAFKQNYSSSHGGGIYFSRSTAILSNVAFIKNVGYNGGGAIYNYNSTVSIVNTTSVNNYAYSNGGGIYNYMYSNLTIKNSIFWEDEATNAPEIYNISYSNANISYSNIQGCGGSGSGWNTACGIDSGNNIDIDPNFVDIASDNFRLRPNSPCVDAGDNSALSVIKDMDNSTRLVDGNNDGSVVVDMGAYEYQNRLKLIYPNGGEIIPSGSSQVIKWYAPLNAHHFTLKLSTDDKKTWTTIENNIKDTFYNFTVDALKFGINGNKNKSYIRVIAYDSSNKQVGVDNSDKPFTIQVLKVTYPNSGEVFKTGGKYIITWETNQTIRDIDKVTLQYSTNGGTTWNSITTVSGNPEAYVWTVPNTPSLNCKIKITLKDSSNAVLGQDISDGTFTILP